MRYCQKIFELTGRTVGGLSCDTCPGCESEAVKNMAIEICVADWNHTPARRPQMYGKLVSLAGESRAGILLGVYQPIKSESTVIVMACKNRYDILKETLPSIVESGPMGLVFVEYNDYDEKSGEFVEWTYPGTDVIRVEDGDPKYAYSRAMNIGAAFAVKHYPTVKYFLFVDVDVVLKPNVLSMVESAMPAVVRVRKTHKEGYEGRGLIGATVKDFLTVGGWNETFDPWWGYRDIDLIERMKANGCEYKEVVGLDVEIPHRIPMEDKEKTGKLWMQNKERHVLSMENWSATVRYHYEQVQLSFPPLTGD